jgi:hypothetical protein
MKFKFLPFFLFLLSAGFVNAAPKIVGKLSDKETSKPIEFATVELLQLPDSSYVDAVSSNADGVFSFEKGDTLHNYCLRIKHLSYKTVIVPVIRKPGSIMSMVGNITMDQNVIGMKEVVVNGAKILVTELPEKTVYTVSDGIKKASVDGVDVLRKVPSVQIDYFNEDIKVEGKSNIVIEVDGITRNKAYLKKLHPRQIQKFEINNTPSGKYDPETDAVINIITDPNMRYGLKGMVVAQAIPGSDTYQGFSNANIDYGLEKVTFYIGGYGVLSRFGFSNNMIRQSDGSLLNRNGLNSSDAKIYSLNTGFNYDPNKFNTLSYNLSYNQNSSEGEGNVFNRLNGNNEVSRIYRTLSNTKSNNMGLNTSLYYKHKFDKDGKHNIEFESRYYNSLNSGSESDFQNVYYAYEETESYRDPWRHEENNTNSQNINARVSYILPLDSVYTFGAGINANHNVYDLENSSSFSSAPNLDYRDFRAAGYLDLAKTFKKGNIKIGSRFENSYVTINSKDKSRYISVLPYANVMYRFDQKQSIRLSYTRRVIRPSTGELNPFVSVIDSMTVSRGNIHLKPAYRDYFQLAYSYRYSKGKYSLTLSPQLFYEYKTRLIKRIYMDIGENRVENIPFNISNGYETGAGISVNTQLAMVMVNSYFRYIYYHIDSYQDQILAVDKNGWSWNVNVMSPLFYKINFMGYFNMNSPSVNGQEEYKSYPMYYLGLRRPVFGTGSVMIMAINPLGGHVNKNTTTLKNEAIYQRTDSHIMLKNAIILTFTYNFKSGKEISARKSTGDQEENRMPLSF